MPIPILIKNLIHAFAHHVNPKAANLAFFGAQRNIGILSGEGIVRCTAILEINLDAQRLLLQFPFERNRTTPRFIGVESNVYIDFLHGDIKNSFFLLRYAERIQRGVDEIENRVKLLGIRGDCDGFSSWKIRRQRFIHNTTSLFSENTPVVYQKNREISGFRIPEAFVSVFLL